MRLIKSKSEQTFNMNLYHYINENMDRVKKEVSLGIMPCSLLRHWEIYSRYDAYKKMNHSVVDSVLNASDDMRVSESSVFKIIRKMEMEV